MVAGGVGCGQLARAVVDWLLLDNAESAVAADTPDMHVGVLEGLVGAQSAGMATKTTVLMTDDVDPEVPADETVQFSLDGAGYEIDLSAGHAGELRERLATYVGAARKAGAAGSARRVPRATGAKNTSTAATASTAGAGAVDPKAVREWAKAHGKPVNEHGRIASSLLIEFQQAHHD